MAADESSLLSLLNLFDSYWFEHQIFSKNTSPHYKAVEKHEQVVDLVQEQKVPRISTTLHARSFSDQFLSSQDSLDFLSPSSVLHTPENKLQTILSGKETVDFLPEEAKKDQERHCIKGEKKVTSDQGNGKKRNRRKGKGSLSSKSLTDLEFEELKGFMDLGFVFSEEDRNSSLVDIIPGLQRFGGEEVVNDKKKDEGNNYVGKKEDGDDGKSIMVKKERRPYLSEAWEIMEQKEAVENMMKNWRFDLNAAVINGNEMDMKHQLRFWAQSVASAVK